MSDQESRPADWDADKYSRVATPQREWSGAVLDRLVLNGDETVMDAGCGSGNVTEDLLAKLPNGRVIGVDGSPSMVEEATERLGEDPRTTFICQDLARLRLEVPGECVVKEDGRTTRRVDLRTATSAASPPSTEVLSRESRQCAVAVNSPCTFQEKPHRPETRAYVHEGREERDVRDKLRDSRDVAEGPCP